MVEPETLPNNREALSVIERIKYIDLYSHRYCLTQLKEDLEWLNKTITFTKQFSEYATYIISEKHDFSIHTTDCVTFTIAEKQPFLRYNDQVKDKYKNIIKVFIHLYTNILLLPNADTIMNHVNNMCKPENHMYLTHPHFIMDHFIYHTYHHSHIIDNYEKVVNILQVFEYFYYKIMNYIAEWEFDEKTNASDYLPVTLDT